MNSTTVQGYCPVLYGGKWSSRELLSLNSIHVRKNPYGLEENRQAARDGGKIAGNARKEIEEHTGKAVITSQNAIDFGKLISDVTKELPENRIDRSKRK